jgi:septal ring factor EnvC (AmiA/AmiB activator)
MPSDCQCSTACETIIKERKVVLNNKEATRMLRQLEKEVKDLTEENASLKRQLRRASVDKNKVIKNLKDHLDRM